MSDAVAIRYRVRQLNAVAHETALEEGFSPLQARILAGRLSGSDRSVSALVRPRLSDLDAPHSLPDIDVAANHIAKAIEEGAPIAIVTDHDADGATSHAIIRTSLRSWGVAPERVHSFISHRMREGYGVSRAFVERMLPELPSGTCVITADQGSADESRIAMICDAGHTVVVTDHHGVPEEGPPRSAVAVVNPVRMDSAFPDQAIAGCHTALLVMAAVRDRLVQRGVLPATSLRVSSLLDYCAVGTIADASSLGTSHNNRIVVQRGLHLMNEQSRPCWDALRRVLGKEDAWKTSDIAFQIATRINARGRLGDAMLSVEFLCAEDPDTAYGMALELDENNRARRAVERENTASAVQSARKAVSEGRFGLCLWLGEEGHAGVHGISASRIVEMFGRPTVCLSPVLGEPNLVTGSVRTTAVVHVRNVLSEIQHRWPGLLLSAGGHAGAGGLRVYRDNVSLLQDVWDQCVRVCYQDIMPVPEVLVDGDLDTPALTHVSELAALEPFGRGFDSPIFLGEWQVQGIRSIGDGTHLKLVLARAGETYDAVWFGAKSADSDLPVRAGQNVRFAYSLDAQEYRGRTRLQLIVRGIELER